MRHINDAAAINSPGSPPSTLFCTTVRTVSPGVLMAAPNTPAQNPERERAFG